MFDPITEARALFEYTKEQRRDIHAHPELGFKEVRTAGVVARELAEMGIEATTGIAETGVVALIESGKPGPVVLCRVDMDALPIEEQTGLPFASQTPGKMHACGHDGHTAMGLTVARILNEHRDQFSGSVKMVFQPAEEGEGGAERMVAEGVLTDPRPDYCLAIHVWNDIPVGTIGVTSGPCMAAAENVRIVIRGMGAHGASPNAGIDPIVAAAQVISALQTIVSRNLPPLDTGVISITSVHGGTAFNVIPEEVELLGTVRSYTAEIRELLMQRIPQVVKGVAAALDCTAEVEFRHVCPAVDNDPQLAGRIQGLVREMFSPAALNEDVRTMGSEDMAFMMADIPGCYMFIGSQNHTTGQDHGHHHPKFDFDEQALVNGVALMTAAVMELLGE